MSQVRHSAIKGILRKHNIFILFLSCAIISFHHHRIMKTSYVHKKSISITLDLDVYDDDYYRDLDFSSLLELEGDEHLEVSITDNSNVEVY